MHLYCFRFVFFLLINCHLVSYSHSFAGLCYLLYFQSDKKINSLSVCVYLEVVIYNMLLIVLMMKPFSLSLICHSVCAQLVLGRLPLLLLVNRFPYVWAFVWGKTISVRIVLPGDNLAPTQSFSAVRSDALGGARCSFVFALTTPLLSS